MILLTITDITENRRAERRSAAEHAVARVLPGAASFDDAAPRVLRAFGAALGVELAEFGPQPMTDGVSHWRLSIQVVPSNEPALSRKPRAGSPSPRVSGRPGAYGKAGSRPG